MKPVIKASRLGYANEEESSMATRKIDSRI
jgi:hypothetical protein